MAITDTDYLTVGAVKIYIYVTDIKFTAKNDIISFVEPLTTNPTSSTYNLRMIETGITVKGYVPVALIGDPYTYSTTGTTLFSALMRDSVTYTHTLDGSNSRSYSVVVTSVDVDKKAVRYHTYYDGTSKSFQEFALVNIGMQKATPL